MLNFRTAGSPVGKGGTEGPNWNLIYLAILRFRAPFWDGENSRDPNSKAMLVTSNVWESSLVTNFSSP